MTISPTPEPSSDVVYIPFVQSGLMEWSQYQAKYSLLLSDMGLSQHEFKEALAGANALLNWNEKMLLGSSAVAVITISGVLFSFLSVISELFQQNELYEYMGLVGVLLLWAILIYAVVLSYRRKFLRAIKSVDVFLKQHHSKHVSWVVVVGVRHINRNKSSSSASMDFRAGWIEIRRRSSSYLSSNPDSTSRNITSTRTDSALGSSTVLELGSQVDEGTRRRTSSYNLAASEAGRSWERIELPPWVSPPNKFRFFD